MKTAGFLALGALVLATGCGGGGPNSVTPVAPLTQPTSISYQDPAGSGWRLVRDSSSTSTHLVLDLVGPAGVAVRGVGFNLQRGNNLAFGTFGNGAYAHDTGVFELKGSNANFEPYAGTDADPVLFVSAPLPPGNVLSTGIFQKDRTFSAKDAAQPLVQVAIDLVPGSPGVPADATNQSAAYGLAVVKARVVPDDIGAPDFILTPQAIAKAKMQDISIAVGTITGH
ncbi:MAG TPA: hypothetical protein VMT83_00625 [Burkholderiaceae bacterium]|nr:hypothetical protein [Burkholderiaceae bacterium]